MPYLPQLPANSELFNDKPACISNGTITIEAREPIWPLYRLQLPAPGSYVCLHDTPFQNATCEICDTAPCQWPEGAGRKHKQT